MLFIQRNVETGKLKDAKNLKESRYESIRAEVVRGWALGETPYNYNN